MADTVASLAMSEADVVERLRAIAADMRPQGAERQRRRHLERADFDRLAAAGFLLTGVPAAEGGLWRGLKASVRPYCRMVYAIARGDPSVALVATMHPVVLVAWLANGDAPLPFGETWRSQQAFCFDSAKEGHWWGTITSEPGSGGDIMKTRTRAEPDGAGGALLTGDKHFGSGSGMSSYMITTAKPDGASAPTMYFMDMRQRSWDGSQGMKLVAEWDGHGMSATQSHAFRFERFPAQAIAWPGALQAASPVTAQLGACMFTAVVVAVVEEAVATARGKLKSKQDEMRAYERVEWTNIVNRAWTIRQVFNGMLDAVEAGTNGLAAASRGKAVIAEMAEDCLSTLSRVIGGGSFSRGAPFGQWAQDVRALGFLRPAWGLAFDQLYDLSWAEEVLD